MKICIDCIKLSEPSILNKYTKSQIKFVQLCNYILHNCTDKDINESIELLKIVVETSKENSKYLLDSDGEYHLKREDLNVYLYKLYEEMLKI